MKLLAFLSLLLLIPVPVAAREGIIGIPYDKARVELRKRGFVPQKVWHDQREAVCDDGFCTAYPEVYDCGGTGVRPCEFLWKSKGGRYMIVETHGEIHLFVDHFRNARSDEITSFLTHDTQQNPR